jgi:hypothetical protein
MTIQWIIVLAIAVFAAYHIVRRWLVINIMANLVAGTLADSLRAKEIEKLVARRDQLERVDISEEERNRRLAEAEDSLARLDPQCVHGREMLWHTAWDIYHECRWTKPKLD